MCITNFHSQGKLEMQTRLESAPFLILNVQYFLDIILSFHLRIVRMMSDLTEFSYM
jgi:hypothetical protein